MTSPSERTDQPHVNTAATRAVLIELLDERRHQVVDHGWTPAHDDEHPHEDFAWLIAKRAVDMCTPATRGVIDPRRVMIEIAAIAIAAIERLDRL